MTQLRPNDAHTIEHPKTAPNRMLAGFDDCSVDSVLRGPDKPAERFSAKLCLLIPALPD